MYKVVPISVVWQSDSITHIDSFSVFFSTTVYHGILNTVPSAIRQDRIYPAECSSVPWMRLHTVFHGGRGNSQAHRQSPTAPFVPYPWQHLLLVALTVAILNGEKSCFTVVLIDTFLVISELSIFSCVPWLAVCFGGKKCLFRFTIHFLFSFFKGRAPKNLCIWTVVLKKTLESPLDCKEIKPVNYRGNQLWILIGRTDAEAETPMLRPPDVKSWLTGKDPDAGKDWRQEKRATEDKVIGWHHRLNGHEFGQISRGGEGQESLAYCTPWGHRVRHESENNNPFLVRLFVLLVLSCVSYWHVLDQSFIRCVACPLLHGLRSQSAAPALAGGASGLLS